MCQYFLEVSWRTLCLNGIGIFCNQHRSWWHRSLTVTVLLDGFPGQVTILFIWSFEMVLIKIPFLQFLEVSKKRVCHVAFDKFSYPWSVAGMSCSVWKWWILKFHLFVIIFAKKRCIHWKCQSQDKFLNTLKSPI